MDILNAIGATSLVRLRSVVPRYPIQAYHGDYQHFTQNKAK